MALRRKYSLIVGSIFASINKQNVMRIPYVNSYTRNLSSIKTAPTAETTELKWEICVGTCIIRPSILTAPMTEMEVKYKSLLNTIEYRGSLKSDHELQLEEEAIKEELIKSGDEIGLDEAAKLRAIDFEHNSKDELAAFNFNSRETEDDASNDLTSCWRTLDKPLILLCNQKLGSDYHWVLPQTSWIPGESLKQTALRLSQSVCGKELKVRFFGNEPCGFYKYKYPSKNRSAGFIGAKVFFYKGFITTPNKRINNDRDDIKDLIWTTHGELGKHVKPGYFKAVDQFIIPDD